MASNELGHLTFEQIEELYSRYIAGEKNKDLVKEYGLNFFYSRLYYLFPDILHEDILCPNCNKPMYSKRRIKDPYSHQDNYLRCEDCGHRILLEHDVMEKEQLKYYEKINERKKKDIFQKRRAIFLTFNPDKKPIYLFKDLNFSEKLYLFCLINCGINKDFKSIKSLDSIYDSGMKFSPTKVMDIKILQHLYQKKIILVDPQNSDFTAFDMDSFDSFDFKKVSWMVNVKISFQESRLDNKILSMMLGEDICNMKLKDKSAFYEFLYEILVEELVHILEAKCFEFNMPFVFTDKIRNIFYSYLNDYSPEEINFFINNSVKTAHFFYNVGCCENSKFAVKITPFKNSDEGEVPKKLSNMISKYCNEPEFPESMITNFFLNYILHGDSEFFKMSPEKYWNKKIIPVYFS
jgi:DNA-directed RNA polymerase subunit RPC12/RpoP